MNSNYKICLGDIPSDFPQDIDFVSVDTESMGLNPIRDRLCVVQLSIGDGKAFLVQFQKDQKYSAPRLKALLKDQSVTKLFHFARADIGMIKHYLDVWALPCYCTKIASRLARTYTDHHSLKELCSELLDVKITKYQQCSDWGSFSLTPQQIDYAASDVLYLHKLRSVLNGMLIRESRLELAQACFDFLKYRVELDLMGWGEGLFAHSG